MALDLSKFDYTWAYLLIIWFGNIPLWPNVLKQIIRVFLSVFLSDDFYILHNEWHLGGDMFFSKGFLEKTFSSLWFSGCKQLILLWKDIMQYHGWKVLWKIPKAVKISEVSLHGKGSGNLCHALIESCNFTMAKCTCMFHWKQTLIVLLTMEEVITDVSRNVRVR